jgi:pimeloyl-ACP methyl ester carboxylesterase
MPTEGDPQYPAWKTALFKHFDGLDDGAILIGHSIGGAFLIHALAEHRPKRRWGAIVLIAPPFFGDGGWPNDALDPRKLTKELGAEIPVFLYHGTADDEVPPGHMALYAAAIPHATTRALADRDHQLNNDLREIAQDIRNLQSS